MNKVHNAQITLVSFNLFYNEHLIMIITSTINSCDDEQKSKITFFFPLLSTDEIRLVLEPPSEIINGSEKKRKKERK